MIRMAPLIGIASLIRIIGVIGIAALILIALVIGICCFDPDHAIDRQC
jgi:hypothetical protein